jgi:intergrase/recombinase
VSSDAGSYNPPSGVDDLELVITQELIDEFFRWCVEKGNDEKTCRDRANYLRKPLDPKNDHSVKAYRLLYKFLGKEPPNHLKVPRTGVDLKVPNDEDIVKSISKAASYSQDFGLIYRLLVESGARLTEVLEVLKGYNPENDVRHNSFYTYILGREKGTKKAFYLFHTTPITSKVSISEDHVSKLCRELGLVRPKYVRKWVATKMASLGIPTEVIDFIQGRTPRSILTKHYLNLYALALQHYPKYVETLKQIIGSRI